MQRYPMTVVGEKTLRLELENLKSVLRPAVIAAIAEARAHGDLKENAEYHAAREEQAFIEARIKDLEAKLSNVQIIDISTFNNDGKVIFGATVHLINLTNDDSQSIIYQIVGQDEADVKKGKISVTSPVARALIGKFQGDEITVRTPDGDVDYEIENVEYN